MVDRISASAYNSWWQFRADSWSRLEEAAGRIVTSLRRSKPIDQDMTDAVHAQCAALAPLEQFWAFPGHAAFGVVQELAAGGAWERLARMVARINRALVTESYRSGFARRYLLRRASRRHRGPDHYWHPHDHSQPAILRGARRRDHVAGTGGATP